MSSQGVYIIFRMESARFTVRGCVRMDGFES